MKNNKYKWAIGIDPGTKTGIAIWNIEKQCFYSIFTTNIVDALLTILGDIEQDIRKTEYIGIKETIIRIENPNLRKWYGHNSNSKLQGAGSIKRDFTIWKEFFEYYDLAYEEVNPKNIKTKVPSSYFKKLTGWEGRTTEHSRDAAMMVYQYK